MHNKSRDDRRHSDPGRNDRCQSSRPSRRNSEQRHSRSRLRHRRELIRRAVAPAGRQELSDPWAPIERQSAIYEAACATVEECRSDLLDLASASNDHAGPVSCGQEDWQQIIRDMLDDLMGDSFACLPQAIARARRELESRAW